MNRRNNHDSSFFEAAVLGPKWQNPAGTEKLHPPKSNKNTMSLQIASIFQNSIKVLGIFKKTLNSTQLSGAFT